MSCETPATSHVQSIRSKFESLNILESLDVTEPIIKKRTNLSAPLLRSATTLDIRLNENLNNSRKRRNNSVNNGKTKQQADNSLIEKKTDNTEDKLKPLKEIRENIEIKLSRHTSDPIKRSSIKRSPAFRINGNNNTDQNGKLILSRSTSIPKQFVNKIDNIVKWCVPHGSMTENYNNHIGLTDTLKAALKQPLPKGPPPKKPPRSFELSGSESSTSTSSSSPSSAVKHLTVESKRNEPIYMEPFSHTKFKNSVPPHVPETTMCSRAKSEEKCSNIEAATHSFCLSCSGHESLKNHSDNHYMCTSIDSNSANHTDIQSNTEENGLSEINTYDEINVLLNAAFYQRKFDDSTAPGAPSDQTKSTVNLYRSLTEKRKDYVKRVSKNYNESGNTLSRFKPKVLKTFSPEKEDKHIYDVPYDENVTSTSERIAKYNEVVRQTVGSSERGAMTMNESKCSEIVKNEPEKLFKMSLLIGYNSSNHQAYIKSIYPTVDAPSYIENLVFPRSPLFDETEINQEYSIILTDSNSNRLYGYCRRVLPENCNFCLPLAYCILSEKKAPGFYFKILREIESRHGQTDVQSDLLLKNLYNHPTPKAGKFLYVKLSTTSQKNQTRPSKLSLELKPKWLSSIECHNFGTSPTSHDKKETIKKNQTIHDSGRKSRDGSPTQMDFSLISSSLMQRGDEILIRRPHDLRLESTELSDLYISLGSELLITVFSSLLLERKVILYSQNISAVTSCILGLQTILYPFQWQHTLITVLPHDLIEICQAPMPFLTGVMEVLNFDIEDSIIINLDTRTVMAKCGDEATILPNTLKESLKISLDMIDLLDQGKMLSSVLISEAFLRFFVELFSTYRENVFNKKAFIESHASPTVRLFLEWFTETAMFGHFVRCKYREGQAISKAINDADSNDSNYYDLFDSKLLETGENRSKTAQNMENIMKNCKIINRKAKTFKDRFKELLNKKSEDDTDKNS